MNGTIPGMGTEYPSSQSSSRNNTTSGGGHGPGIGVTAGVLVVVIVLAIASYLCNRIRMTHEHHHRPAASNSSLTSTSEQDRDFVRIEIRGTNEHGPDTRFPKLGHSGGNTVAVQKGGLGSKANTSRTRCSICLRDYKEGHALSSMPECHHLFHTKCIEPWLKLNPSCPICRSSPLPTPVSTPLIELVPLSGQVRRSNR